MLNKNFKINTVASTENKQIVPFQASACMSAISFPSIPELKGVQVNICSVSWMLVSFSQVVLWFLSNSEEQIYKYYLESLQPCNNNICL